MKKPALERAGLKETKIGALKRLGYSEDLFRCDQFLTKVPELERSTTVQRLVAEALV